MTCTPLNRRLSAKHRPYWLRHSQGGPKRLCTPWTGLACKDILSTGPCTHTKRPVCQTGGGIPPPPPRPRLKKRLRRSYLNGADRRRRQRLKVFGMQDVARPCREHFEHFDREAVRLAQRVRGGHGVQERLAAAAAAAANRIPRVAALPAKIRAAAAAPAAAAELSRASSSTACSASSVLLLLTITSYGRKQGGCNHDPKPGMKTGGVGGWGAPGTRGSGAPKGLGSLLETLL